MSCLPCFDKPEEENAGDVPVAQAIDAPNQPVEDAEPPPELKAFNFRELASATKNFRQEYLLGEGGFGKVYKGTLQSQVVLVKQLDRNGMQGNKEFQSEVTAISLLRHKSLVELIGYCADGDQRLLVYEFMSKGPLDAYILDVPADKEALDWKTRMKVAEGVALGLEYLHEKAKPPVVYRELKSSNVLLNDEFNAKLFDYGLTNTGQNEGGKMHLAPRVTGTYGYSAPEYERSGELTLKSDMYSFGVLLLELVTGRRALDTSRPTNDQNLVAWAQPYFKNPKKFPEIADPNLQNKYPVTDLNQVVGVTAMCLQEEPSVRPLISDVVVALSCLKLVGENTAPPVIAPTPPPENQSSSNGHQEDKKNESGDDDDEEEEEEEEEDSSDDDESDESDEEEEEEAGGGGDEVRAMSKKHGKTSRKSSKRTTSTSSSHGSDTIEYDFKGGNSMRISPSTKKSPSSKKSVTAKKCASTRKAKKGGKQDESAEVRRIKSTMVNVKAAAAGKGGQDSEWQAKSFK